MKKLGIILLTLTLIFALVSCGGAPSDAIGANDGPTDILVTDGEDAKTDDKTQPETEPEQENVTDTEPDTQDGAEPDDTDTEPEENSDTENAPSQPEDNNTTPVQPAEPNVTAPAGESSQKPAEPVENKPAAEPEPPVTTEPTPEPTVSPKEIAESYMDKSVSGLFAEIGQPTSSDYAPSCLGDGEDGELFYDGFTVYTYREGDKETVTYVE